MATDKLTLIAELKDRLTGPANKAVKSVRDLGDATDKAAAKSEKAAARVERADKKRASSTERTAALAARSEDRRAKSTEQSSQRQSKAFSASSIASERAAKNHVQASKRTSKALGDTGGAASRAGRVMDQMAGKATTSASRTEKVMAQMSGRSAAGINLLGKAMDRLKPDRMASRYNTALSRMLGRTEQVAGRISANLRKVTDTDFVNYGAMGATAVGGLAAAGGFRRIADVQQSEVVMETMGLSKGDRDELMGQFKGLAQDTPFSTGSIASLGSGLIASGMDQSKVESSLQGAIDTAALFGMSMEEIALPLKQMQAKGVLQGDDLNQLMDRNIPVMDWIAKQKGVDRSEVKDMVSRGEVSADDMFAAMAANSAGGAEKASGTLKGSWTNFMSSISQGGEAFLVPMVDDLTEALQIAKESVADMKPQLTVLGKFVGAIVKGLAPFLPVIVPGLVALGAALVGLKVASTAASGIQALSQGAQWLSQNLGGGQGATKGVGLFGREVRYAQSDVRSLAGQGGLVRLDDRLTRTNRTMGRGERAVRGLAKGFGIAAGAAIGLMAATKGMEALGKINAGASEEQLTNTLMTGGDVNKQFSGADWANHQGSILGGTMSGVNGIGDVIQKQQNQSFGDKVAGFFSDGKFLGYKDGWQKGFDQLSAQDTSLAGAVGTPEAGAAFTQIMSDARRAGADDQDVLKALPEYRAAVTSRLSEKKIPADDSTLLQYMGSTNGFRSGGYTGDGSPDAPAGVVHKKEYVFDAARTAQIGVENLRAIHAGRAPAGESFTFAPTVYVTGAPGTDLGAIRSTVQGVLREEARKVRNTHGTRAKRGAR